MWSLVHFRLSALQVGTSSVVYPAAMFAPQVSARGVPVAEFNTETTPATNRFRYGVTGVGGGQRWAGLDVVIQADFTCCPDFVTQSSCFLIWSVVALMEENNVLFVD